MKRLFIALGLVIISSTAAMAYSTIYTDDIGRMHFLGKDPGGSTTQQIQNYSNYTNSESKELTDVIYKNTSSSSTSSSDETKVNSTTSTTSSSSAGHTNKSKGTFTYNKGAMDASNPYTYGNTNIDTTTSSDTTTEKKHFWDNW